MFDSDKSADRNLVADTLAAASLAADTQAVGTSAADKPVGNTAEVGNTAGRPAAGRIEKQASCYIESKHLRYCR